MDSKEPEKKPEIKPEEIADAPLPEEALNEVVGGGMACCSGKHISEATITVRTGTTTVAK
jgi:hypothetical protein